MRPGPLTARMIGGAGSLLALATLMILLLVRPGLPHIGSLTAPLTADVVRQALFCAAWLASLILALSILVRALHTLIHPPGRYAPIRLPDVPRTTRSRPSRLPAHEPAYDRTPYVLTIPRPLATVTANAPPKTTAEAETQADPLIDAQPSDGVVISLLGPPALEGLSQPIKRSATRELIAYLALHPHGASRDELIEALWPGENPQSTRPRFWQSVSEAKRALGDVWIHDDERYLLDREKARIDIDELERLLATSDPDEEPAALARAAALWRGAPLSGCDYRWADTHIHRLHATFLDLLGRVGHIRLADDDARGALQAAEQAITLDELHEPSWRLALQAEHTLGLRSSLTRRYERLAQTLDEQLGLQPSHETRMLYRQLLGQT